MANLPDITRGRRQRANNTPSTRRGTQGIEPKATGLSRSVLHSEMEGRYRQSSDVVEASEVTGPGKRRAAALGADLLITLAAAGLAGVWQLEVWFVALTTLGLLVAYRTTAEACTGTTAGKKLLAVRVIPWKDGRRDYRRGIGLKRAAIRNLLVAMDLGSHPLVAGGCLSGDRRWGDRLAGTVVVTEREFKRGTRGRG